MTEIYLIRHTNAEGNGYRVMQGQWDGNITALGKAQLDALAQRFRTVKVDAVFSSDLSRAMATARAVARYHALPVQPVPALRELRMGRWERRFWGDLLREEPENVRTFRTDGEHWQVEGSETLREVGERALSALTAIARDCDGKSVALVSHGVTIRCLLSRLLNVPVSGPEAPICHNTGVCRFTYENGVFTPDYINDCSHLEGLSVRHWDDTPVLWARPMEETDSEFYCRCYEDAWMSAHGDLTGFHAEPYLRSALSHGRSAPGCVLCLFEGEAPAGLLDLDPKRGAHAGYGWISLFYLCPPWRGRGCSQQLLGRAVLYFAAQGRRALRLTVAEENEIALHFYQNHGFRVIGEEPGSTGRLLLMEHRIGVDYV